MKLPSHLPNPHQVRHRMPRRFRWIDDRAGRYLQQQGTEAYALYLLLILRSDRYGLSYLSEKSLSVHLRMHPSALRHARRQLTEAGLIVYQRPYYQVLDLGTPKKQDQEEKARPDKLSKEEIRQIIEKTREKIRALPNP